MSYCLNQGILLWIGTELSIRESSCERIDIC